MGDTTREDWSDRLEDAKDEVADRADRAKNRLIGKAKEAEGRATGDTSRENEGKFEQAKEDLRDAGEKVKDAFSR
jgi:uncharacterized protein YjbJ (UPF0337 family)